MIDIIKKEDDRPLLIIATAVVPSENTVMHFGKCPKNHAGWLELLQRNEVKAAPKGSFYFSS